MNGKVQFGIRNENAKRILWQNIWKIGNDSQAWHSFGRWRFHNRARFRGPISICLKNSHRSHPYKIKVNDRVAQMIIERVNDFEWIEGTEDDFKIEEGVSENAPEAQHGRKRMRKLEGFGSTGI